MTMQNVKIIPTCVGIPKFYILIFAFYIFYEQYP